MRTTFHGYYSPSEEELDHLWSNCLFVLDANVLLNLYRYSPNAGNVLIRVLKEISDRLWIPHQAALEYQENRLSEIIRQEEIYNDVSKTLSKTLTDLKTLLRRGHLSIDVEKLLGRLRNTFDEIEKELAKKRLQQHPNLFSKDNIRDKITVILEGKVGLSYPKERLLEIYELGEERYKNKIPPGYKDEKKENVINWNGLEIKEKYGDLILWFQIIDKAKEIQMPVILVTDDTKEDWWWQYKGRTVGPRHELIAEIGNKTDMLFYMYTPTRFIDFASSYFELDIAQEILDEIRGVTEDKESEIDTRGIKYRKVTLLDANLEGADLSGADLQRQDLHSENLRRTNLSNSNLRQSNLSYADLVESNLEEADLSEANLSGSHLTKAYLSRAKLVGAYLVRADLSEAVLYEADLSEADLSAAVFVGANLNKAKLTNAELKGAALNEADLSEADLTGAVLTGAVLVGADLCGTNLSNAELDMADLSDSKYDHTTIWPKTFAPQKRAGAILVD